MKQWVKSQLDRIILSHIAWMIAGVLLTEFITWLLYKNPKKITAPGLSAIVAVCALLLAVYSAYQIKKWINGKINEKGFKKCEAIMDKIQELAMAAVRINSVIDHLYITKKIEVNENHYNNVIEKLNKEKEKVRESMLEMHTHELHLKMWGFEISEKYSLSNFNKILVSYLKSINLTIKNSKQLLLTGQYNEAIDDKTRYKEAVQELSDFLETINDSSFHEIFVPYER